MARIELKTDADTRGAKRLNKELEKTDKELEEIGKTARGTARQAQKLAEMADPTKRLNREYAILAKHVKEGRVSMEDAEKIAGKYQRRMDRLGDSSKRAVGPGMMASVSSLAGGYLSVASAVGIVTKALQDMEQQAQSAADATFAGLGAIGELQQISGGDPDVFLKDLGFARSLVARGIFTDVGQAADTTFALGSAGFSDAEKDYLAGLSENKLVRGEGLVGFGGALRKSQSLFPDGISVQDITDKVLATSAATQANATQTALATSQFGAASANLGYSGDASLAGLVLIEEKAKNIDEAATQMANLLDAIDKGGLSTGTFAGTIDAIQARIDAGEGAFDVLGNKRAVKGFRALSSQRGLLDAEVARIAGASGAALRSSGLLDADPITRAAALKEAAVGRAQATQDSVTSERELLMDAVIAERQKSRLAQGRETMATLGGWMDRFSDWTGSESIVMAEALRSGQLSPQTQQATAQYLLESGGQVPNGVTIEYLRRIAEGVERGGSTGRQE